jgi:transposase-like protein
VRAEWRSIKARRQQKRVALIQKQEEYPMNGQLPLPPVRTPERAAYMRSFINTGPALTPAAEANLLELYETDAPNDTLKTLFGIGSSMLGAILKRHNVTRRGHRPGFRSRGQQKPGHVEIDEHGTFVWAAGAGSSQPDELRKRAEEQFGISVRNQRVAQPATSEQPDAPSQPRKRHTLGADARAEVIKLYSETDASVDEICQAYNASTGQIYRIVQAAGLPLRGRYWVAPRPAQVLAEVEKPAPATTEASMSSDNQIAVAVPRVTVPITAAVASTDLTIRLKPDRAWRVSYIIQRDQWINAPSVDEAIARVRGEVGDDVDIVAIVRA